jgi:TrmH family RNA methyltransferase
VFRVSGENDDIFRHVEFLKNSRTNRRRFGEFFVEGVKSIDQARRHRWPIRSLIYVGARPLSSWARETLATVPEATRVEISPAHDLLDDLLQRAGLTRAVEARRLSGRRSASQARRPRC